MFTSMHSAAVASGCRQAYGSFSPRRLCFAASQHHQSSAAFVKPTETSHLQLRQVSPALKLGRRGSLHVAAAAASSEKPAKEGAKKQVRVRR